MSTAPRTTVTYKYRIKDSSARITLSQHAYAVNQVWNWCVGQQRDIQQRYYAGAKPRKWATAFSLAAQCKGVGKELGIHQQTVQSVCDRLVKSRDQHRRCPQFRSSFGAKRARGWIPFQPQSRQVDGNSIVYLGKRYRWFGDKRRPLPDAAKGGEFVEDALGRWYVCFQVEVTARANGRAEVGIDLGLKSLAALSDGRKIAPPHYYRLHEERLAVAQRAQNKQRVRRIHAKIANCRRDFLHKLSTELAGQNAIIAVGNVNARRLAKTRMAKSVLDAGWSTFRAMLKYKSAGYIEVDEKFTTQACSDCGSIGGPKGIAGLEIRNWVCSACGASHDRDVNSARNILNAALSAQRLDGESRESITHG